jgi:addiction module RelE/StbE family toxin
MAYKIQALGSVRKDLKRPEKELQEEIRRKHFLKIKGNPFQAYPLGGEFRGLRSYHFSYRGTDYRIVYEILKKEKIVLILMIGKREGFYSALRRRLD